MGVVKRCRSAKPPQKTKKKPFAPQPQGHPKTTLKACLQNQSVSGRRTGISRHALARNGLFWNVLLLWTSSTATDQHSQAEKNRRGRALKMKVGPDPQKWPFSKTPDFTTAFFRREICKTQTPNSHCKASGFRNHGPLINSSRAAY